MTSESNKVSARVYPWHDLAWDLALADGMDPAQIESRLAASKFEGIEDAINTEISTSLWRDLLEGKVPVRKANGNPLEDDSKQFRMRGPDTPHLTADEGNEWLKKNRYRQVWEPAVLKNPKDGHGDSASASDNASLNFGLLATPDQLFDAFGAWGLREEWFADLNSHKWLLNSRKVKGRGQRGQVIEPLFLVFSVMTGLMKNVRKVKRLSDDTAWRVLAHKFPKVYAAFQSHDPRDPSGD